MRPALLIATAILLVGTTGFLMPEATAQVGTSTLQGMVCAAQEYHIMADAPGKPEMACGRGLPNATVRLTRPGPVGGVNTVDRTATTDADGVYSFGQLADGSDYTLTVTRRGFETATAPVAVAGNSHQDIVLEGKAVTQTGRVVSKDGRPLADVQVGICCDAEYRSVAGRTGPDGAFSIQAVGGYRGVSVTGASGFHDLHEERLVDGTSLTLRLEPLPPPNAFVTGVVRDQDGNPVAGVRIDAYSQGGCCPQPRAEPAGASSSDRSAYSPHYGGANHTTTGADGRYRIGVFAGDVGLTAHAEGFASRSSHVTVARGDTETHDIRLLRYPEKTARIEGRVTDADGNGLSAVAITVRSPEYGLHECSTNGGGGKEDVAVARSMVYPYPAPDCAIRLEADGSFSGLVTPGYTIVEVWYQHDLGCQETHHADGAVTRTCGPDYYSWARTLNLAADATTRVDVRLVARPAPDATLSGYVLDEATGEPIPGAWISIWNQDNGSGGEARTDGDGSYRVRLRSGYTSLQVRVQGPDGSPGGYLSWQGNVAVQPGDNSLDVALKAGEEASGGWGYPMPLMAEDMAAGSGGASGAMPPGGTDEMAGRQSSGQSAGLDGAGSASGVEDLNGGLGPYDADARKGLRQDQQGDGAKASPAAGLAALAALAVGAAVMRRRR